MVNLKRIRERGSYMFFMVEAPLMVEEVSGAPLRAELEIFSTIDFYLRPSIQELNEEVEAYQLEQEELARLEREKQEALEREREAQRQKQLEEQRRQEELERQRQLAMKPTFDPYNVTSPSNVSSEQFYRLLGNTDMVDVAWVFPYAEKTYGINALFLAGLTALESGWGGSSRSVEHNNMTGYGINTDAHVVRFANRSDSILATAKLLSTHYIPTEWKYYNGTSVWNINQSYCASDDWASKIITIANKLLNRL